MPACLLQDCISIKGNSSNVHVSNVTCYESGAMCVGSIGSNAGQPDFVENVVRGRATCATSRSATFTLRTSTSPST